MYEKYFCTYTVRIYKHECVRARVCVREYIWNIYRSMHICIHVILMCGHGLIFNFLNRFTLTVLKFEYMTMTVIISLKK